MVVPWCGNVDQLHNLNVHMSKYCIAVLVYTLAVSQFEVLHWYIRGLAYQYCSIASVVVLHQQYCISGSDFGVAVSADQREPMLPWRRSHITLPCANVPCIAQMYLVLCKCNLPCANVPCLVQMYLTLCKCTLSCANVTSPVQM